MIFVTVGTHEQPFNRLVAFMDKWAEVHDEKVIIQTGFSTYNPINCVWDKFYPYKKMLALVQEARIVITHGGPSSFILPLQVGKTPIVVPRKYEYNEHVNNHQIYFAKTVEKRLENIKVVENVEELSNVIDNYDEIVSYKIKGLQSNKLSFCNQLNDIVNKMF